LDTLNHNIEEHRFYISAHEICTNLSHEAFDMSMVNNPSLHDVNQVFFPDTTENSRVKLWSNETLPNIDRCERTTTFIYKL
jgi:hypothetical protein